MDKILMGLILLGTVSGIFIGELIAYTRPIATPSADYHNTTQTCSCVCDVKLPASWDAGYPEDCPVGTCAVEVNPRDGGKWLNRCEAKWSRPPMWQGYACFKNWGWVETNP